MEVKGAAECCAAIYSEPQIYADCFCFLKPKAEVVVDLDGSTDKFYKVWTESGIGGYCLRHQISLEEGEDGREHT